MKEFHAILCGTSLLTNFGKTEDAKKLDMIEWARLNPTDIKQIEIEKLAHKGDKRFDILYEFLTNNPKANSAELNTFIRFCELYNAEREALLYCTDTGTGVLCANVIHEYLQNSNYARMVSEPQRLKYFKSSEEFDDALVDIIERLTKIIINKKRQGFKVHINASGGFKPESTYAVIAALLSGADSIYYRFETFRDLIKLPAIPLKLNIEEHKRLIEELRDSKKPLDTLLEEGFERDYIDRLKEIGFIEMDGIYVRLRRWLKYLT